MKPVSVLAATSAAVGLALFSSLNCVASVTVPPTATASVGFSGFSNVGSLTGYISFAKTPGSLGGPAVARPTQYSLQSGSDSAFVTNNTSGTISTSDATDQPYVFLVAAGDTEGTSATASSKISLDTDSSNTGGSYAVASSAQGNCSGLTGQYNVYGSNNTYFVGSAIAPGQTVKASGTYQEIAYGGD